MQETKELLRRPLIRESRMPNDRPGCTVECFDYRRFNSPARPGMAPAVVVNQFGESSYALKPARANLLFRITAIRSQVGLNLF